MDPISCRRCRATRGLNLWTYHIEQPLGFRMRWPIFMTSTLYIIYPPIALGLFAAAAAVVHFMRWT